MSGTQGSGGGSTTTLGDGDASGDAPERPLQRGDVLGRYLVTAAIGYGGMGIVYAAYDPELDRRLAVKVLHPHRRGSVGSSSGQERMLREARAMARLHHPNVVTVHDVGTFGRSVFVAMELIDGETLTQWLAAAKRPWSEVLSVFLQAAEGLEAAHAAGLVHRDFKPDNVMIAAGRGPDVAHRVVVMDFGLARSSTDDEEHSTVPVASPQADSRLTQTGVLLGTPAYMAPEQHLGGRVTALSDQFAFCVALHEALWGMRPFAAESPPALAVAVTSGLRIDPPDMADVPGRVHRALVRGLAVAPGQRWPSMRALMDELRRDPTKRRRRAIAIAAVPVLAIGGAIVIDRIEDAGAAGVCAGGELEVAEVWNDGRRSTIAAAIAERGLGHGEETRVRVEHALDLWADDWTTAHREACEATNVARVQSIEAMDRKMSCLRRRLNDVDAVLVQLERPTDALIDRAVGTTIRAVDLSACADPDALTREVPPDEATRMHVEALRGELATARAQKAAGRSADAKTTLEAVLARLDETDWPPLRAEVLFALAQVLGDLGQPRDCERVMTEAYWVARRSGSDRIAAQTSAELIAIVSDARPAEVAIWEQQARADVERLGDQGVLRARLLDDLAMRAIDERDLDRAEALHRESIVIWERLYGPESIDVAVVEHGLGNIAFLRGDDATALQHYQHELAIYRAELGEHHPQLADVYIMLGNVAHRADRFEDAEREYSAAVEVLETSHGDSHVGLGGALNGLALVQRARGRPQDALATLDRALAIVRARLGDDHPQVAIYLANSGAALTELGRIEEALARHREALALRERKLGADHPVTSESLENVGNALLALGRPGEAVAPLERALAIVSASDGSPEHLAKLRDALARARAG